MHRLSAALVLLTGITSLAQSPAIVRTESNKSSVVLRNVPIGPCPVAFLAERQSSTQILTAASPGKSEPALGLHLTLYRQNPPAIESVEVTVYGLSQKSRILPTGPFTSDADPSNIISKSFELKLRPTSEKLVNADVWMSKVGALRWVDINEIRYADGAVWHSLGFAQCRAVPSDYVLIGRR